MTTPPFKIAPAFWFRPRSDGGFEGPIHDSAIEQTRKDSGAWLPLYAWDAEALQDAIAEALRARFIRLPRSSFVLNLDPPAVVRVADRYGRWLDFSEVHTLFDPIVVDESLKAASARVEEEPERESPAAKCLTDAEIEAGRHQTFSTDNPFCPCTDKTMRKAVRWAEQTLAKRWGITLKDG